MVVACEIGFLTPPVGANLFVADFMGSPAMNLVPVTIGGNGAAVSISTGRSDSEPLLLSIPNAPAGLAAHAGREAIFGIRPEALRLLLDRRRTLTNDALHLRPRNAVWQRLER